MTTEPLPYIIAFVGFIVLPWLAYIYAMTRRGR